MDVCQRSFWFMGEKRFTILYRTLAFCLWITAAVLSYSDLPSMDVVPCQVVCCLNCMGMQNQCKVLNMYLGCGVQHGGYCTQRNNEQLLVLHFYLEIFWDYGAL